MGHEPIPRPRSPRRLRLGSQHRRARDPRAVRRARARLRRPRHPRHPRSARHELRDLRPAGAARRLRAHGRVHAPVVRAEQAAHQNAIHHRVDRADVAGRSRGARAAVGQPLSGAGREASPGRARGAAARDVDPQAAGLAHPQGRRHRPRTPQALDRWKARCAGAVGARSPISWRYCCYCAVMRLASLAAILLAAAATAAAQAPHEDWRTIETRHFRVHYPVEFGPWATRAASRLESIRAAVVAEVGFAPEQKTDVMVVDPVADANGETLPLLDTPRMIFFAHPPEPESVIGEYRDRIDLLAVHETAHLVHLLRPSRNPFERFVERWLLPVHPIVPRAPRWIFEGYATVIEGRITGSGRPSGTLRAAILRKWALEGRLPTYGQLDSDQRFLGMSMAYLMGSAFLEWLEQREGPDAMRKMWARLTARQRRSFDEAFIGVYGERPDKLYGEFVAQLTESARAVARAQPARERELWQG